MEAKGSGRVNVLPVRHKENSQRINVGLHDSNLSSHQSLLFGRGSQDGVAVYGRFRRGRFFGFVLVCPQATCAIVTKNRVVQILNFICHLQALAGGELWARSEEAQWTAN